MSIIGFQKVFKQIGVTILLMRTDLLYRTGGSYRNILDIGMALLDAHNRTQEHIRSVRIEVYYELTSKEAVVQISTSTKDGLEHAVQQFIGPPSTESANPSYARPYGNESLGAVSAALGHSGLRLVNCRFFDVRNLAGYKKVEPIENHATS